MPFWNDRGVTGGGTSVGAGMQCKTEGSTLAIQHGRRKNKTTHTLSQIRRLTRH